MLLGFAVADVTGVRPLGGLVLVLAAAWCVQRWQPAIGTGRTVALLAFWLAAFAASHVLAGALGTWGAVALVAAAVGAAAAAAGRSTSARRGAAATATRRGP
jgi:hypothetical protein